MMGITLEESSLDEVPQLLEEIIKKLTVKNKGSDSLQKDYMFLLIIVSMIENGFFPVDSDLQTFEPNSINADQISKWKSDMGTYEALFVEGSFYNVVRVIMSPLGAMVLVNAVIHDLDSETYTVCIPISRYIVSPQSTNIPKIFRDLKQFSISLKNKVIAPVKSRIFSSNGCASASLIGLPEEVLHKIMMKLSVRDVLNVSETCNTMRILLKSDSFWHDMLKRDYPNYQIREESGWRERYIIKYKSENDLKLLRTSMGTMHDYMEYSDYVSYIDNPMWNVFL